MINKLEILQEKRDIVNAALDSGRTELNEEETLRMAELDNLLTSNTEERSVDSPEVADVESAGSVTSTIEIKESKQMDNTEIREAYQHFLKTGELRAAGDMTSSTDGAFIPTYLYDEILEAMAPLSFVRNLAQNVKTASTTSVPYISANPTAAFVGELTAYNASDLTSATVTLNAYKMTVKSQVAEELLQDSAFDIEAVLVKAFAKAFAVCEETAFLTGDGTGDVNGVVNATANTKELAATAAVTKDELIEVIYALDRQYRPGSVWVMADSTALAIAKMKEDVTTSGTTPYWWTDAVNGEPPRLLGYPVYTSSAMAALGASNKAIVFGNFGQGYVVADRGVPAIKRLQLSEYAITFAGAHRLDGEIVDGEAFVVVSCHHA